MTLKECGEELEISKEQTEKYSIIISNKFISTATNLDYMISFKHLRKHGIGKVDRINKINELGIVYPSGRTVFYDIQETKQLPEVLILCRKK